jgi:hydroxymethylpyrimidine pyrophosphatase-like HAD family hydrolase
MNCIKKLFVTDMDGTFLDAEGCFDRKRLERLVTDFERAGYLFAVASGRAVLSLSRLFEGFEDRIAIIAENGSLVLYQNQTIL